MAPQTDEFGAKVGLLAGLVVVCARAAADRPVRPGAALRPGRPSAASAAACSTAAGGGRAAWSGAARLGLAGMATLAVGIVVAAGARPRVVALNVSEVLNRLPHRIDPATMPAITVGQDVVDFDTSGRGDKVMS